MCVSDHVRACVCISVSRSPCVYVRERVRVCVMESVCDGESV